MFKLKGDQRFIRPITEIVLAKIYIKDSQFDIIIGNIFTGKNQRLLFRMLR